MIINSNHIVELVMVVKLYSWWNTLMLTAFYLRNGMHSQKLAVEQENNVNSLVGGGTAAVSRCIELLETH